MASAPNTRGTQGQGRDPSLREGRPAIPGSAPPAHGPRGARGCPATACEQLSKHPRPCWADTDGNTVGRHRGQREGSTGVDLAFLGQATMCSPVITSPLNLDEGTCPTCLMH